MSNIDFKSILQPKVLVSAAALLVIVMFFSSIKSCSESSDQVHLETIKLAEKCVENHLAPEDCKGYNTKVVYKTIRERVIISASDYNEFMTRCHQTSPSFQQCMMSVDAMFVVQDPLQPGQ